MLGFCLYASVFILHSLNHVVWSQQVYQTSSIKMGPEIHQLLSSESLWRGSEAMLQRTFDSHNFLWSSKSIVQVAVCMVLIQQVWSNFLKTFTSWTFLCFEVVCVSLIPSQKKWELIGTKDSWGWERNCHIHFFCQILLCVSSFNSTVTFQFSVTFAVRTANLVAVKGSCGNFFSDYCGPCCGLCITSWELLCGVVDCAKIIWDFLQKKLKVDQLNTFFFFSSTKSVMRVVCVRWETHLDISFLLSNKFWIPHAEYQYHHVEHE